jgi:hypothetical protein
MVTSCACKKKGNRNRRMDNLSILDCGVFE